jgi:hypothetical protein
VQAPGAKFTRSRRAPVETGHGNCATTRETQLSGRQREQGVKMTELPTGIDMIEERDVMVAMYTGLADLKLYCIVYIAGV